MNLKKALVGCTLAFSLVVGGLFVVNGKGNSTEAINDGKNVNSVYKLADGESYPPIFPPTFTVKA